MDDNKDITQRVADLIRASLIKRCSNHTYVGPTEQDTAIEQEIKKLSGGARGYLSEDDLRRFCELVMGRPLNLGTPPAFLLYHTQDPSQTTNPDVFVVTPNGDGFCLTSTSTSWKGRKWPVSEDRIEETVARCQADRILLVLESDPAFELELNIEA